MTSYVSITSYTLTRVTAYLHCDVMGRISQHRSVTEHRTEVSFYKFLLDTAPLHIYPTNKKPIGCVFNAERIVA